MHTGQANTLNIEGLHPKPYRETLDLIYPLNCSYISDAWFGQWQGILLQHLAPTCKPFQMLPTLLLLSALGESITFQQHLVLTSMNASCVCGRCCLTGVCCCNICGGMQGLLSQHIWQGSCWVQGHLTRAGAVTGCRGSYLVHGLLISAGAVVPLFCSEPGWHYGKHHTVPTPYTHTV